MFAELFTVDEQMEMWEKMNEEQDGRADRLLSETMKHGNQQTNIVNKMCDGKLLSCSEMLGSDGRLVYVEYGAGKAGLSSFVAQKLAELHPDAVYDKDKVKFLVIDRDSRRFKKDKYVKGSGFEVERQKFDIADFDLCKYTALKENPKVCGIAKHLCGGATDLALTSFEKLSQDQLDGLSMATCCHHTCDTKIVIRAP